MTIPIEPGPWSFLAGVGKTLGAFGDQREKDRRQRLSEAQDQAKNYLALRLAGLMKPKDFEDPHIQAVFHSAGYGPVSADETPDEMAHIIKGSYLRGLINPGMAQPMSDEQRAVAGAPERGLTQQIDAKVAQSEAAVPQAQLQGTQATAQIPGAGLTAQTGQQQTQDKTFNDLADRYIEGLYAQTKKLPTSGADAFQTALADPQQGQFAKAAGQSYFDQAIERLRAKLADEATKRAAAQARLAGSSGTGFDDIAKIYQNQQARLNDQLKSLDKPSTTDQMMSDMNAQRRARGKQVPVSPAETRVAEYKRRRAEIEQQLQQIGDQLTGAVGPKIGAPGVTPPGQSGSPPKRAAADEYEARVRGVTDPARRKAIAAEIAKKYNINVGGAQ